MLRLQATSFNSQSMWLPAGGLLMLLGSTPFASSFYRQPSLWLLDLSSQHLWINDVFGQFFRIRFSEHPKPGLSVYPEACMPRPHICDEPPCLLVTSSLVGIIHTVSTRHCQA